MSQFRSASSPAPRWRSFGRTCSPALFARRLVQAQDAGTSSLGLISLDGTKAYTDASNHAAVSDDRYPVSERSLDSGDENNPIGVRIDVSRLLALRPVSRATPDKCSAHRRMDLARSACMTTANIRCGHAGWQLGLHAEIHITQTYL